MKLKRIIRSIVPKVIWNELHIIRRKHLGRKDIETYQRRYDAIIRRIKQKNDPLKVVFFALEASAWKWDSVYQLMLDMPMFNPIIVVCPQVNKGYDFMLEKMQQCSEYFRNKKYNYIVAYNENTYEYFDAHSLNPDVICYTNPYEGLIDSRYYIDKFPDSLICYVNYAYHTSIYEWGCNLPFHQHLWRYYVECMDNLSLIKHISPTEGKNCVVTGYPMYDEFLNGPSLGKDWKQEDKKLKRIIWSPHHSISVQTELLRFSTFELYYDIMWKLAEKYKDEIQVAFKPHPLLKEALYRLNGWGEKRTDAYYKKWAEGENTILVKGEYIDLFNSSDAIINDSGSFLIEYLYTQKPCLYLNNYNRQEESNKIALEAFECWYKAITKEEIERFIVDVVIGGGDTMQHKRVTFYNKKLLPPNGCSVAENIINDIKNHIGI